MAFAPHHRVTIGGTLQELDAGGPDEIWACNVNVVAAGGGEFDEDAYLASIGPNLKTWFAAADSYMSRRASLTYVKCNAVGADGRYSSATATHRYDVNPAVPGAAAPIDPQIITVALSWVTTLSRGPGSKGRIYPPNVATSGAGQMTINLGAAGLLANAGVTLLQILNNSSNLATPYTRTGPVCRPVVSSAVNATNTDIIGCRVGTVKDVQRRRKNALVETYSESVFLAASS